MGYSRIAVKKEQGVLWVTLNRPEKLNVFDPVMIDELGEILTESAKDDSIRVLAVTGAGRAFCAGGDLSFVRDKNSDQYRNPRVRFLDRLRDVLCQLEDFPKPTIAAVNGLAVAGGLEIILCCDIVIASEEVEIGDGHAIYGILPGGGATARLARKIGPNNAKYLMFTGRRFAAARFKEFGLVSEVVPGDTLDARVSEIAVEIASRSPEAARLMKSLLNSAQDSPLQDALTAELLASASYSRSYDLQEGVAAFLENRVPVFKGC